MYLFVEYDGRNNRLVDFRIHPVKRTDPWIWSGNEQLNYPIANEGATMIKEWSGVPSSDDCVFSGVIADWLSDHRSELLAGASGPTDPAVRLDALIDYLRQRFNSVYGG